MNYKLMLLEIFAILASYLILMLPVAYAYSFSDYLPEEENQFQQPGQNNQIDQANPEPIFKSFVDYFTSSLPELIGGFFSAFSNIVSGFIDTLFPSVRAQSCNYNTTCDSGEDIGSCCYDCGCQNDDYYCDISSPEPPISSSGCKLLSDIGLAYKGPYNIEFTNCNQAHEVNLTVEVVDAPQTMVFESKTFYLNNNQYSGTIWEDCEPGTYQDYYICPITIPVLEDCTEGQHVLSQNSLELNITFRNGRGSGEKSLTTGFPDITINSFTCGNDIYEPELGETPNNCCYDAGCPFNQYCDISNEDRNNQDNRDRGSCEPLLRDVDLTIRNPHPLHFPAHDDIYGDTVSFMAEIFNPPQSISITNTICSIDDASCTLSCSDADSDPDIYNMTCDLTFIIDDYETSQSYLLRPDINISVRYNNASGSINAVLRPNTFTISITESYCGDGYPGPGETQDNCCYDVPCDTDEYCDIVDTSNTSSGTCREDNVAFAIDSTNPTQLTVYTIKEQEIDDSGVVIDVMVTEYLTINVISHINNIPEGRTSLETFCDFGTEDIECFVDEPCGGELIGSDTLNLTCDITIPKIKYRELGSDYYNSQNKQITLNTNTFNLNITFNNGSGQIERSLSDSFDPIIINLIAGCGNDECEAYLDESVNTCCFDCPCPGNQQCIGDYVPGENQCINPEDIVLDITIPDQECTIQALNGECTFLGGIHFGARIYGAPDDLEVIDPDRIKYLHSGITDPEHGVNCDPVPPTQNRDYICTIEDFPDISPEDTDTEKEITVFFNVVYGGGIPKELSDSSRFSLTKDEVDEIRTCEERKQEIDEWADEARGWEHWFDWIKIVVGVVAISLALTCIGCSIACLFGVGCGCAAWACTAAVVVGMLACLLGKVKGNWYEPAVDEIASVKNEFNAACGTRGVEFTHDEFQTRMENIRKKIRSGVGTWDPTKIGDEAAGWGCRGGQVSAVIRFVGLKATQAATNINTKPPLRGPEWV